MRTSRQILVQCAKVKMSEYVCAAKVMNKFGTMINYDRNKYRNW